MESGDDVIVAAHAKSRDDPWPMFSARTRWDLTPNRLATLAAGARARGRPLLDLTETNPTRAGLTAPGHVLESLARPRGLRYQPDTRGLEAARRAVAADHARRGSEVDPAQVVLTASTSEAYAFLFKLLCDPGDAVAVPRPSYPLFEYLARLEGIEPVAYPLRYDGEWHAGRGEVEGALTPRTRAVVVVSPNNPTGSYLKRDEADALLALCAERGLAVIADEVFADFAFRDDPRRVASLAGRPEALTFALGGLSKSCGLPQLKLAWIAASGPDAACDEALARLEIVADTYLSVGTPVQEAAPEILRDLPALQAPLRERTRANLSVLRERAARVPVVTLQEPEGGWSAVLRVPAHRTEDEWCARLIEEDGVLVQPGYFFDFPSEAFLVVSLLPPPDVFAAGVARLLARLGAADVL
jgi:aspartate/methionine/tyrosine aminotransferase